jgi:hypothetical protein
MSVFILALVALAGCKGTFEAPGLREPISEALPPSAVEQVPTVASPLKCFERAKRFNGVIEVPCDIAEQVKG